MIIKEKFSGSTEGGGCGGGGGNMGEESIKGKREIRTWNNETFTFK